MPASLGQTYEFGEYTLDVEGRVLRRRGQPVPLTRKVFELLLYLVQHPDRVIDKDELLSALWPDTVVEESNLAQNVFVLRKTLAASEHVNGYIVTVPGRGYRADIVSRFQSALNPRQQRPRKRSRLKEGRARNIGGGSQLP